MENLQGRGSLTIVGTPIGNMADLSPRAVAAIETADVILCEDTRRTNRLLQMIGVAGKSLVIINEHTEFDNIDAVKARLDAGERAVLVSDAGMPVLSDPGHLLIDKLADSGFVVEVAPGPCAVSSALAVSGFSGDRYMFEGFLPRKGEHRSLLLKEIASRSFTTVIYEAPTRVGRTLADLSQECGLERRVVVARELTKMYEEVVRGSLSEVMHSLGSKSPKGEYVILVEGIQIKGDAVWGEEKIKQLIRDQINSGLSRRDAVLEAVEVSGQSKSSIYKIALDIE